MTRMVEVIYEDKVLKPVLPIEGLQEHGRAWVIICHPPQREALRQLAGTLTHEEAEEMQRLIDEEFEKVEGDW